MTLRNFLHGLTKGVYLNALPDELFRKDITTAQKRELFSKYVDLVEIENHNYCNRVCSFCPNVFLDRRSHVELASDSLFEKIISNLESINYDQTLVWARYHETFADDSVFDRMREARRRLPRAYMMGTTNGDYLTKKKVALLRDIGIDRVYTSLYLPDGQEDDVQEMESMLAKFIKRTGLEIERREGRRILLKGDNPRFVVSLPYFTTDNMSLRGGLMTAGPKAMAYRRTAVCLSPIRHVVIDYNGKGVLCCQARSDSPAHADAVIGDLSRPDYDLFDFYGDLWKARANLSARGTKGGICTTCDVSDQAAPLVARYGWATSATSTFPFLRGLIQNAIDRKRATRRYESDEVFLP